MSNTLGNYHARELEEFADAVKVPILNALVEEGLLDTEVAANWCETHTIIRRSKSFFRTLCEKWLRTKERETGYYYLVVKKVGE